MELNLKEFVQYCRTNLTNIYEGEAPISFDAGEVDSRCESCNREAYLKIRAVEYTGRVYDNRNPLFFFLLVECPKCKRKRFTQFVQIRFEDDEAKDRNIDEESDAVIKYAVFRLYTLPAQNESYLAEDIPLAYTSLHKTVSEALFCTDHGKYISASIMFRRAIQIIVSDILGGQGRSLYHQLKWLKENKNNLDVDLTDVFHDNSTIIKEMGNQAAHPDKDIDLHEFTQQDMNGLHDLFLSIVNEVFVKPDKLKKLQDELRRNRKIK